MTSTDQGAWERYRRQYPIFESAANTVSEELRGTSRRAGLRVDVQARAKTVSSFAKKIRAKGYTDPWAQVTDKVGARVIVESLSDLHRMVQAIDRSSLEVLAHEDKGESADADRLFYPGHHIQVILPKVHDADDGRVECEI